MFLAVEREDLVRVPPNAFMKPKQQAITDEINRKYSNKILHNVGYCIQVYDILEMSDPIVHACQDGSYQCRVKFNLIVFRPFIGQVITGQIKDCSLEGIRGISYLMLLP
jgi:DNA-directed RNA polymerase III subunit RPC8